jgi:hypothetical protein
MSSYYKFSDSWGGYRFQNTLEWLESDQNIPIVYSDMGKQLGLEGDGFKHRYEELQDYLETTWGKLTWHMFALSAYEYELRDDIETMGAMNIIKDINSMNNPIISNPRVEELMKQMNKKGKPLINNDNAAMFGRLFNYHHCLREGRPSLFRLRNLFNAEFKCKVCGAISRHSGYVVQPPTESVCVETWTTGDIIEGEGGSNVKHDTRL